MITIRPEIEDDFSSIYAVTEAAFKTMPYAGGDEQDVIDRLRRLNAITLSLVAIDDFELVGQITFSPASITSQTGRWYALGPVSVLPSRQAEGIGRLMIEAGIEAMEKLGAWGCILTGNPEYYTRFGFELAPAYCPENESEAFFMLKRLGGELPRGRFAFHPAFYTDNPDDQVSP